MCEQEGGYSPQALEGGSGLWGTLALGVTGEQGLKLRHWAKVASKG